MRRALGAHRRDFVAIVGLVVLAGAIAAYILLHQPAFTFGQSYYSVQAPFSNAAAVTPGQGQAVTIAGVQVGQVGGVKLVNGRAVVTMNIFRRYAPIYRDATVLLRPRTPLKDMYLALDPGTKKSGAIPDRGTLSAAATSPTVDLDQILSSLDADTRSYLLLLLSGGAQAFRDPTAPNAVAPGPDAAPSPAAVASLSGTFKRFAPLNRDTRQFATLLAARNRNLRTAIHNLQRVATALGGVDGQLASLIAASNTNFAAIASQDANLEAGLALLPGTLTQTNTTLGKVQTFSAQLGPALSNLLPFAHALGPALQASRPLFHDTTPVIRSQLRPFSIAVQPVAAGAPSSRHPAVQGDPAAHPVDQRHQHAVQHVGLPAEGQRAGIPVLGLVAGPHRVHADRRAGRPRGQRARDLHGHLPGAQPARDDHPGGQPVDRAAARPAERTRLEPDQVAVLSSHARRAQRPPTARGVSG